MASVNDKVTDTRNAGRPVSTTVSSGRSAGGTSLACASLTGWPTASKVHFVTYQIDSNSNPIAGTQLDCYGIVSGSTIGSMTVVDGTDAGNSIGDVVEMLPTAAWGQDLADAINNEHSRTGAHEDITSTSITNSGAITSATVTASGNITSTGGALKGDTVSEQTAANGVTIDGLNIKDGLINTNNSVPAAALATSAIKLGYVAAGDSTTSSTSVVQVTNATVTVTVPAGGRSVLVMAKYSFYNSGVNNNYCSLWSGTVGSGTQLDTNDGYSNPAGAPASGALMAVHTPAAGSVTYNLGHYCAAGSVRTYSCKITVLAI